MKVSQVAKIIGAYYMQLRICEALSEHEKAISLTSKKKRNESI